MRARWIMLLLFPVVATFAQSLQLRLDTIAVPTTSGHHTKFSVRLVNHGKKTVTLVLPGDGSAWKWRTPFIGWSVLPAGQPGLEHPTEPKLPQGLRCGVMNPIRRREIFRLKSESSRELEDWIGSPSFADAGLYRVVFYYRNIPALGGPVAHEDSAAVLKMISQSDSYTLMSNEVIVEVLPNQVARPVEF